MTTNTKANTRKARTTKAAAKAAPAKTAPAVTEAATVADDTAPLRGLRAKASGAAIALPKGATVAVLVQDNPKKAGSGAYNRFACYMRLQASKGAHGYTVADVLDAGVQPSDLRYNLRHGYIEVQGVAVDGSAIKVQG